MRETINSIAICFAAGILIIAGCSDSDSVSSNKTEVHAVSANIGPEGGEIETTSADSTNYKIKIPAGALSDTVRITITPSFSDTGIYSLNALAYALNLEPEGLTFDIPAEVSITVANNWPVDAAPAILHNDSAECASLLPTDVTVQTLTAEIDHFSRVVPVAPNALQIELFWNSILFEIDTYGVSVWRVRDLVYIFLHVQSNESAYPSINLNAWRTELRAQTNDLKILGSLKCNQGQHVDGQYILNSAMNIASLVPLPDLIDPIIYEIANCVVSGTDYISLTERVSQISALANFNNKGPGKFDEVGPDYFFPYSENMTADTSGTDPGYVSGQCETTGSGAGYASQSSYIIDDSASQTVTISFQGSAYGTGSSSVTWDGVSDCYTLSGGSGFSSMRVIFELTETADLHLVANVSFGELAGAETTVGILMGDIIYHLEVGDEYIPGVSVDRVFTLAPGNYYLLLEIAGAAYSSWSYGGPYINKGGSISMMTATVTISQ